VPGAWETVNDYEIKVHLVNGNSYHAVLVLDIIAIAPPNKLIPSYQLIEEEEVVRNKCKELWGDRVRW
jgi:hypothetical protein